MNGPLKLVDALHLLLNHRTLYLQDIKENPTYKLGMNHLPNYRTLFNIHILEYLSIEIIEFRVN